MSNLEQVRKAVAALKGRLADTDGGFLTDVEVSRQILRTVVEYAGNTLATIPVRPFKVGDKVQEICDDLGDDKPVGTIVEMTENGQQVMLENTRHAGRTIHYFDEEIEPYGAKPASKFSVGQKVEVVKEIQVRGMVVKAGTVGAVVEVYTLADRKLHEFEVMFSGPAGTVSFGFDADELKAVTG